jgi:hypothetical protein
LATLLRRLVLAGAAACLAALAGLFVFERSGLLRRALERRFVQELGPLGGRVTLERASLAGFERALVIEGLALAPSEPAGTSDLVLDRVHVALAPGFDRVQGLRIEGGSVRLGPRLYDDFNRLVAARGDDGPETPFRMPPASLSGFDIALELFDSTLFEVGTLDLNARAGRQGAFELAGRLQPSLGGALTSMEPIRVNGSLSAERAQLWAAARGLALESHALPEVARGPMQSLEGGARLTLDSSFELDFAAAARPRGTLRASLEDGHALLGDGLPELEDVALELEARLAPPIGATPWTRDSWDARALLSARSGGTSAWAWAELGRRVPGSDWVRAWAAAEDVRLERAVVESLGLQPVLGLVLDLLAPAGRLDLASSLSLGRAAGAWTHAASMHVRADGELGLAYQGFPDDPGSGVPLPLSDVRGEMVLASRSGHAHPWQLAGYDLSAQHGSGKVTGWTRFTAPERAPGAFPFPELDLVLSTPSLAVDGALLAALAENRHLSWIGPRFAPRGGTVAGGGRRRTAAPRAGTKAACDIPQRGSTLRGGEGPVERG